MVAPTKWHLITSCQLTQSTPYICTLTVVRWSDSARSFAVGLAGEKDPTAFNVRRCGDWSGAGFVSRQIRLGSSFVAPISRNRPSHFVSFPFAFLLSTTLSTKTITISPSSPSFACMMSDLDADLYGGMYFSAHLALGYRLVLQTSTATTRMSLLSPRSLKHLLSRLKLRTT